MNQTIRIAAAVLLMACCFLVEGLGQRGQSPAAQRPPETLTPQTYPPELVEAGQPRFVARCGFCHGRDAGGGEGGPDLTRSLVVAEDAYGNLIGDLLQAGTAAADMHAFDLDEAEFEAIVAFIHARKTQAESVAGGRQFVDVADLQTGDAAAGREYFNGSGGCAACHSATGDLAGVANRFEGINLMRRMLYPNFGRPAPAPANVTVTLASGETVIGPLASQSEFVIAIRMEDGESQSWSVDEVEFVVDDPVAAHFDQLGRYTDDDMHDVYAYLETLR